MVLRLPVCNVPSKFPPARCQWWLWPRAGIPKQARLTDTWSISQAMHHPDTPQLGLRFRDQPHLHLRQSVPLALRKLGTIAKGGSARQIPISRAQSSTATPLYVFDPIGQKTALTLRTLQACSESELYAISTDVYARPAYLHLHCRQAAIQYGYNTCKTIGITLDTTAIPTGATAYVSPFCCSIAHG